MNPLQLNAIDKSFFSNFLMQPCVVSSISILKYILKNILTSWKRQMCVKQIVSATIDNKNSAGNGGDLCLEKDFNP